MPAISVPVYNSAGERVSEHALNPNVFAVPMRTALVHQVVVAQRANARAPIAHTKGRGEVRGGGRKPWRQKGTGRARHGSIRSPLWVGGGVTFGPTKERNFSQRINKKMRVQAMRMILSDKVRHDRFVVLAEWGIDEAKTKKLHQVLQKLPGKGRKATLVTDQSDQIVIRAAKNLPNVASIGVKSLNVYDVLRNEYMIVPKKLISIIEKQYAS